MSFVPLPCAPTGGVLGAAGPTFVNANFPGAAIANTWYAAALADAQAEITGFPQYPKGTQFDGPVRFIYGELSDYVKPSHHVAIERLFSAASMCRVEGAGHWVYADQPQGFMDCLNPFLGR